MTDTRAVTGTPLMLLRAEGAAAALLAGTANHQMGGGWGLFALLLLAPDLAMLGYLAGPRAGAACYNLLHTTLLPVALGTLGWLGGSDMAVQAA
jgi:hypothetical protein